MGLNRGDVCHPLVGAQRLTGYVWWLAQALTALDRMTPNAFTRRAGQTRAAPIDLTTRNSKRDGCSSVQEAAGRVWPRRRGCRVRLQRAQVLTAVSTEALW